MASRRRRKRDEVIIPTANCGRTSSRFRGIAMNINLMDWDAFMVALWAVTVIGVGGGLLYIGRRL